MNRYESPSSSCRSSSRFTMPAWIDTSSAETGSSSTSNSGSSASARAMPMRCRCPPENSCGKRFTCSGFSPTAPAARAPARSRGRCRACGSRIGSLMIEPTVMRGSSDAYGSWKTICIFARSAASRRAFCSNSSSPRSFTEPEVGSISCSISRPVVRLPAARLPDQPERLALRPRSDAGDGLDRSRRRAEQPAADRELLHQVGHLEHGLPLADAMRSASSCTSSRSASRAPIERRREVARRRVVAGRSTCISGAVRHAQPSASA